MSPIAFNHDSDSRVEAGLLGTQEEEKTSFMLSVSNQAKSPPVYRPPDAQRQSEKMFPLRRVALILTISLLVGLGFALAEDSSLATSCMRWAHGPHDLSSRLVRTALNKRQDGGLANATTAASSTKSEPSTPLNPGSTPPLTSLPSSAATQSSQASGPVSNPTPTSTTPRQSLPPPTSTTSTVIQVPPTTPMATSSNRMEVPTTTNTPETPGTSTTRQGPVSESSSSSTVVPMSSSSTSTKAEQSSIVHSASSPSHHGGTPTTSDVPLTTTSRQTITTGRVSTSSPVAHTLTTTLENGGTLTITSTSWVAVVPTNRPTSTSEPKLQNAAPQLRARSSLVLALGAPALAMLLFRV